MSKATLTATGTLTAATSWNFNDSWAGTENNGTADALEPIANIPLENDLIEVKIERMPGTGDLVLTHGPSLRVYYDHAKTDPVVFPSGTSEALPFNNNTLTVFVEWISTTHGTDTLSLVEPATAMTHDIVRFHSFRSFTVVFGGLEQDPADTDGDGSIGDPRPGEGNREGIFDLAQHLYNIGRDVMAFDEADYTLFAESVAEREIKNAIDNRFVDPQFMGGVAIMGYSQGGGVVQNMIESELDPIVNPQYLPVFGVYLDAIVHDSPGLSETDWPDEVVWLLNIYQANELGGNDIIDGEVPFGYILEEIDVSNHPDFNNTLTHLSIDDDQDVLNLILFRHFQLLLA